MHGARGLQRAQLPVPDAPIPHAAPTGRMLGCSVIGCRQRCVRRHVSSQILLKYRVAYHLTLDPNEDVQSPVASDKQT